MGAPTDFWEADAKWIVGLASAARAVAAALPGSAGEGDLHPRFAQYVAEPLSRALDIARKFSPADRTPASSLAWAWFLTGGALAEWADLAPEVGREADRAEETDQLVAFLREPPKDLYPHRRHLQEAAEELSRLAARLAPEAIALGRAVTRLRAVIRRLPEDFRPLSLRDGLRTIRGAADLRVTEYPGTGIPPDLPVETATKLRAAAFLVIAAEAAGSRLDDTGWERVLAAAVQIARPVVLDFDRTGEKDGARIEEDPKGFTVVQTGIAARDGGEVVWSRPAVVRRPPKSSPLRIALAGLASEPGPLAGLADRLLKTFPRPDPPAGWWAVLSADQKGEWWWLVQQAAARPNHQHTGAVLAGLRTAGVHATGVAVKPGDVLDGPWFVASARSGDPPAGPAIAVQFPDGTRVGPSVCLRLAPSARPLVRCLEECWPFLHRLRAADPGWSGWAEFNDAVWALAVGRPGSPSGDAPAGLRAFQAVLRRVEETREVPPPLSDAYLDLGRRLHDTLTREMGVALPLRLGPDLQPHPLTGPPTDGTEVEWVGGPDPVGTAKVVRFPEGDRPARLRVSVGPGNDPLLPWLSLPRGGPRPLAGCAEAIRSAPWSGNPLNLLNARLDVVAEWAIGETPDAREWWTSAPPADPWWRTLVRAGKLRTYPTFDPDGRAVWPADAAPVSGQTWEFSSTVPVRGVIGEARFGPTPGRAGGVFSLGPQPYAPAGLAAAARLRAAAPGAGPVGRVWEDEVASFLGHPRPPAVDAVADWLPAALPAARDPAVAWFDTHGYRLVEPAPADATPRYDPNTPAGQARVFRYGYAGPTSRPGEAVRSAGPPPPGYPELAEELRRLGGTELVEMLAEWPAADGEDELEALAQAFYSAFYERCGGEPVPDDWRRAADIVARVMRDRFGWHEYRVQRRNERPDREVDYDPRIGAGNDTVRRVLRPGLETADGVRKVSTKVTFGGQ